MIKVMLDAGHAGKQNGSPCDSRYWESLMSWELHKYLREALTRCGFYVGTTRATQTEDLDVYYRGRKALGYDLFLSLHSNTPDNSGTINNDIDRPVIIRYLDSTAAQDQFALNIGNAVREFLGAKQNTQLYRKQGNNGEYYGVLRGAKAAGCPVAFIIEHGFHTCTPTVEKLLPENGHLSELAEIETKVICNYYGVTYVKPDAPAPEPAPQPTPAPVPSDNLKAGDKVKIIDGAYYWNGVAVPKTYIGKQLTISKTMSDGRCLIEELYSWVANKYLVKIGSEPVPAPTPEPAPAPNADYAVGDKVKINDGAQYTNGVKVPNQYIGKEMTVSQINGNNLLIKELYSWVNKGYCSKEGQKPTPTPAPASKPTDEIKVGDKVKIVSGATYTNGVRVPPLFINKYFTVQQVGSDKVLIEELYSWVAKKFISK